MVVSRRCWVFDLDGTLVPDTHDYAGLKDSLGCPRTSGILEWVAAQPGDVRRLAEARIDAWEAAHADAATPLPDALALLDVLATDERPVGVFTRNTRSIALRTLAAAGLADRFAPDDVIGRCTHAPKPAPDGLIALLVRWDAAPADAVMVGDGRFDVLAGRAAGVFTVLVERDSHAAAHAHLADLRVPSLVALL
jgi:HAD superfamily hydrolase (TIGR01509 family)